MKKAEIMCDCQVVHQEKVDSAKKSLLNENHLKLIANFYKALSDSTRIKIINLLNDNELCVCDIAVILNMTKSAVSHQLKYLREIDIVKNRKVGKEVFYTLADEHVKQIFTLSQKHMGECHKWKLKLKD